MAHGSPPPLSTGNESSHKARIRERALGLLSDVTTNNNDNFKVRNSIAATLLKSLCVDGNASTFDAETMCDSNGERYLEGRFYCGERYIIVKLSPGNNRTKYPLLYLKYGDEDLFETLLMELKKSNVQVRINALGGFKSETLQEMSQKPTPESEH